MAKICRSTVKDMAVPAPSTYATMPVPCAVGGAQPAPVHGAVAMRLPRAVETLGLQPAARTALVRVVAAMDGLDLAPGYVQEERVSVPVRCPFSWKESRVAESRRG